MGTNCIKLFCPSSNTWQQSACEKFGSWGVEQKCPSGMHLCKVRGKIEPDQKSGDDTSLNGLHFECC